MPQLNPGPWFMLLIFTWYACALIIPTKVLNHTIPNDSPPILYYTGTTPWHWPWH
uniref:ATP synthase complex subunit 8 n=1 Tax=Cociella crocodilus TaxID=2792426 RepID=A0A5J6CX79_9TELE|nr:ATP synthase F0 subunit 8 [Cociella crocodilus]QEQ55516.1 ATP synthase F0 subunit 8 [Cociella crocodilus]